MRLPRCVKTLRASTYRTIPHSRRGAVEIADSFVGARPTPRTFFGGRCKSVGRRVEDYLPSVRRCTVKSRINIGSFTDCIDENMEAQFRHV